MAALFIANFQDLAQHLESSKTSINVCQKTKAGQGEPWRVQGFRALLILSKKYYENAPQNCGQNLDKRKE